MSRTDKLVQTESRPVAAWGWGQEQGLTGNRHEETSWDDGNIQGGDGCRTLEIY